MDNIISVDINAFPVILVDQFFSIAGNCLMLSLKFHLSPVDHHYPAVNLVRFLAHCEFELGAEMLVEKEQ